MDGLVRGGLTEGEWRIFMDPNNQAGIDRPPEAAVLDRLKSLASLVRLSRNCRNTAPIVVQTCMMTGADLGEAVIEAPGLPVKLAPVGGREEAARELEKQLESWMAEGGIDPGSITILSPLPIDSSCVSLMSSRTRNLLRAFDDGAASTWPGRHITFARPAQFKGLENRCIALVDLDDFDGSARALAELYVGMTRANAGLWIAEPLARKKLFDDVQVRNARRALRSTRRP